jgi:hypothetical protein
VRCVIARRVSVSAPNVRLGVAAVPFAALSCPVMLAWPSRGRLLVISVPTSEKLALTDADSMVVPLEKLLGVE